MSGEQAEADDGAEGEEGRPPGGQITAEAVTTNGGIARAVTTSGGITAEAVTTNGGGQVPQVEEEREPGRDVELVDVLGLPAEETAQGVGAGSQEGRQRREPQRAPRIEIGQPGGQGDVDGDRPRYQLGRRQPGKGPVERVEHGRLRVGQVGYAQKEVGVPQRQASLSQRLGGIGPVGIEIGVGIATREDAVGERDVAVGRQAQQAQEEDRPHVHPACTLLFHAFRPRSTGHRRRAEGCHDGSAGRQASAPAHHRRSRMPQSGSGGTG